MASVEFEASGPLLFPAQPEAAPSAPSFAAVRRGGRPRLALVSTYSDLCGIAAYTKSLEKQLADAFDVRVFDLNQFLLRATHARVRRFADRHIQEICREIREFDAVNLQLEHGTLGRSCRDIFRRFTWIARAAPRLSVTFHTVFEPNEFDFKGFFRELLSLNLGKAIALRSQYNRAHLLSAGVATHLRRAQRLKPVAIIVHTRRELWHMRY
ncbi:MAG TPA: hypothetical protein VGM07_20940, partial [Stellaceae bacterium]